MLVKISVAEIVQQYRPHRDRIAVQWRRKITLDVHFWCPRIEPDCALRARSIDFQVRIPLARRPGCRDAMVAGRRYMAAGVVMWPFSRQETIG